ncbi:hypothetical protein BKP43_07860 [Variovorax boronicumulans]|jgi:hypothetical protein|uniref:DUF2846 domain-containing protein n=1 Tax=Variovorax boronicumulans TaxID=436515 RepID=UPI001553A458|nr:DUF2846 domain-containing protein [Variovorax boronicumulans]PBI94986.1 hypothetical protein BKP43_07860 [Variovorax boronicumulans]
MTALAGLVLAGCSATGPQFKPVSLGLDEGAVVYVYRNDQFKNSAMSVPVLVDENLVGKLANSGYLAIPVTQGQHLVRLDLKGYRGFAGVPLQAQRGESIYLRLDSSYVESGAVGTRSFRLTRLPEALASPEIALTKDSK